MADIFEEVDDDLKEENLKKLWDRYGKYAAAAVALIVGGAAAIVGWQAYVKDRQTGYSDRYGRAGELMREQQYAEAAGELATLAAEANPGISVLARFSEAAARRANGEESAAIDIYDTLAQDDSVDTAYRNLATLLSVMMQADSGDPATLQERLAPLAENGPWRHSANELSGVLSLRAGDISAAKQRFQTIADDPESPVDIRARAAEMLQILGQ